MILKKNSTKMIYSCTFTVLFSNGQPAGGLVCGVWESAYKIADLTLLLGSLPRLIMQNSHCDPLLMQCVHSGLLWRVRGISQGFRYLANFTLGQMHFQQPQVGLLDPFPTDPPLNGPYIVDLPLLDYLACMLGAGNCSVTFCYGATLHSAAAVRFR
jgi:hypothetical protein